MFMVDKDTIPTLADVPRWIECQPTNQSRWFDSQSVGHMPGLWVGSPVEDTQAHTDVLLPLFLSPFPSLKMNE